MLRVGIYTPYDRSETALSAVQLADWLLRMGIEVKVLSGGRIRPGVHDYWDHKARRGRTTRDLCRWARGATHLCWFGYHAKARRQAELVRSRDEKRQTRNILFPDWGMPPEELTAAVRNTDRTICLSPELFRNVQHKLQNAAKTVKSRLTWSFPVSPISTIKTCNGYLRPDQVRMLVVIPRSFQLDLGTPWVKIFDELLQEFPELRLTMLFEGGSVRRQDRSVLREMLQRFSDRMTVLFGVPYSRYASLSQRHDFVYYAATRSRTAAVLNELSAPLTPVICHKMPPLDYILDKYSPDLAVPCLTYQQPGSTRPPVAEVQLQSLKKQLQLLLPRKEVGMKAAYIVNRMHFSRRQKQFEDFLSGEFF